MKFQFGLSTLLVGTAFASVWVGAIVALPRAFNSLVDVYIPIDIEEIAIGLAVLTPAWLPVAFVGYSVGRKSLSIRLLLTFGIAEALALLGTGGAHWYARIR